MSFHIFIYSAVIYVYWVVWVELHCTATELVECLFDNSYDLYAT